MSQMNVRLPQSEMTFSLAARMVIAQQRMGHYVPKLDRQSLHLFVPLPPRSAYHRARLCPVLMHNFKQWKCAAA